VTSRVDQSVALIRKGWSNTGETQGCSQGSKGRSGVTPRGNQRWPARRVESVQSAVHGGAWLIDSRDSWTARSSSIYSERTSQQHGSPPTIGESQKAQRDNKRDNADQDLVSRPNFNARCGRTKLS